MRKLLAGLFLLSIAFSAYVWLTLPDVRVLKTMYPVVRYEGPDLPPVVTFQRSRPRNWVSLRDVSHLAVEAILISEDSAYYQHHGYDLNQIREAAEEDWERGSFARGASTITQQVARNVFLSKDKNLWRKAKELYLAIQLDQTVGKRRVLEIYLNVAEWGPEVFGIREAAQYYFHKSPAELDAKEGAFLAMLLPSPIRYGVSFRHHELTEYARGIIEDLLDKMARVHDLTEQEKTAELARPLDFENVIPSTQTLGGAPHALPSKTPSGVPQALPTAVQ